MEQDVKQDAGSLVREFAGFVVHLEIDHAKAYASALMDKLLTRLSRPCLSRENVWAARGRVLARRAAAGYAHEVPDVMRRWDEADLRPPVMMQVSP